MKKIILVAYMLKDVSHDCSCELQSVLIFNCLHFQFETARENEQNVLLTRTVNLCIQDLRSAHIKTKRNGKQKLLIRLHVEEEKPLCMDIQVAPVKKVRERGDLPVTMTRKESTSRWNGIEIEFTSLVFSNYWREEL